MSDWALPNINLAQCNRCGVCVEDCPESAVEMGTDGPFFARPGDCTFCAACEEICPQGAITCSFEIVWGAKPGGSRTSMDPQVQEV